MQIQMKEVNEVGDEMLNTSTPGSREELRNNLLRLNSKWTEVYQKTDTLNKQFAEAQSNWNDFKGEISGD